MAANICDCLVRVNLTTIVIALTLSVLLYILILQREVQEEYDNKVYVPHYLLKPMWLNAPPEKVISFALDLEHFLHRTDKRFLSFSIDTSQIHRGLKNPSLTNRKLRRLVSHLQGGYLRIGGNAADLLVFSPAFRAWPDKQIELDGGYCSYQRLKCPSPGTKPRKFSMYAHDWNEINEFAIETGFKVLFDLNVILRDDDGWNSTNAELLLDFSFAYQYEIDFQLGNEPNSFEHLFGVKVAPEDLAKDYNSLRKLLQKYRLYNTSFIVGPDITNPIYDTQLEDNPVSYLLEFLRSQPNVDAVSWHFYNTRPNASLEEFLDIETYEYFLKSCDTIFETIKKAGIKSKPVWLTETGSSYGGGAKNLSDRFISSLHWADKLGLGARTGLSVVIRQSLYRGAYALIDGKTLTPNPDYWVSVLHKRLVKETVLNITNLNEGNSPTLRAYAHCSSSNSVVVFGVNIANISQGFLLPMNTTGQLYCIHSSDLLSRTVKLNGEKLLIQPNGDLPTLKAVDVNLESMVSIPSHSVFFIQIAFSHLACSSTQYTDKTQEESMFDKMASKA